jgi:peptidoglycan-associated lipoprotein
MRLAGAVFVVLFSCACQCTARIVQPAAPQSSTSGQPAAAPQGHDIVALLAGPDGRKVGRVIVASPLGGTVELIKKQSATRLVIGQPPHSPFKLSDDQIRILFGDAFAALPPAPRHFLLYFERGSDELTPASQKLTVECLAFVKSRPVPDVSVIGHTDTVGPAQANVELARNRATLIRDRLVAVGLDAGIVSVASHGEADLLVFTPDETPEPRNRRVDVSVR